MVDGLLGASFELLLAQGGNEDEMALAEEVDGW
jgi:hypothetical protein